LGSNRLVVGETSAGNDNSMVIPSYRQSLSTTTPIYLKMNETYVSGTPIVYGRLSARRVR
jgi:hypothetical protein